MPNPSRRSEGGAHIIVAARLTTSEAARFDLLRGGLTRGDYLRKLIAADDRRQREERQRERIAAGRRPAPAGHEERALDKPEAAPAQSAQR